MTFASLEGHLCIDAMSTVQLGVRIPASLYVQLAAYLTHTGASKTDVVVSALAHYLGCADEIPLTERVASLEEKVAALEALQRSS